MRCLYLLLLVCLAMSAQEMGELSAERPGFTVTSGLAGLGVFQLEQGYTFASFSSADSGSKTDVFSGPQALLRFGISDAFEIRFSSNGYSWQSQEYAGKRSSLSGANDYAVGAKVRVLAQTATRPEVSIVGSVSLPALGSPFTTSAHDPAFILAAYKDLPGKFSLAANLDAASITDPRGRFFGSGQSLWVARSIGRGFSWFGETFRTFVDRSGREVAVDGGLFRSAGKHAQIDAAIGHTVAGDRPMWFASIGCVMRIPRAFPI